MPTQRQPAPAMFGRFRFPSRVRLIHIYCQIRWRAACTPFDVHLEGADSLEKQESNTRLEALKGAARRLAVRAARRSNYSVLLLGACPTSRDSIFSGMRRCNALRMFASLRTRKHYYPPLDGVVEEEMFEAGRAFCPHPPRGICGPRTRNTPPRILVGTNLMTDSIVLVLRVFYPEATMSIRRSPRAASDDVSFLSLSEARMFSLLRASRLERRCARDRCDLVVEAIWFPVHRRVHTAHFVPYRTKARMSKGRDKMRNTPYFESARCVRLKFALDFGFTNLCRAAGNLNTCP
ncbi:hypothetical protein K438DRAFT_1788312 [Mycena galopus ATCC 62051]|nr:hypothetical protein K438DRAFT_1788312 [Mycena galopus ATCC 62051]